MINTRIKNVTNIIGQNSYNWDNKKQTKTAHFNCVPLNVIYVIEGKPYI